ncbi:PPR repeat [Musa troglodytarum]|uniref:peroxidase n=1 Tax=Musa troglodytarum TaxID=320322 RepID=A0A9E7FKX7_9LILI|nr:PPR repeat [Musa troglodytarum]
MHSPFDRKSKMAVKPTLAARPSSRYLDRLLLSLRNRRRLPNRIWPDDDNDRHRHDASSSSSAVATSVPCEASPFGEDAPPPPPVKLSHPLLRALESSGGPATPPFSQTLAQLIVAGLALHRLAAGRVIKALCACPSSVPLAVSLFSGVDDPDAFLSNIILRSYISFGRPDQALAFFRRHALPSRVFPNHFTFPLLAKLFSELGRAGDGWSVHSLAARLGFESDLYVRNSLIHMYSSLGDVDSARKLFDLDLDSDFVTWNSMIDGYVKNGMVDSARRLFDDMSERDIITWNVMIAGHAGVGDMDAARDLFIKMPERDVVSWNTLIDGYARKDETGVARELFDVMPIKNMVSWNIVLALYARIKNFRECLKLFDSDLARGKWVHSLMKNSSGAIQPDVLLSTALVNMYSKCGDMHSAREIFDSMEEHSVATWNSMIIGYGLHGNGEKALELFMKMEKEGPRPNEATFVCVLSACAHGGMVLEGWWCFDRMIHFHKIEPKVDHFGCLMDLLSRAGFLNVSEKKLVQGMPVEPVPALWGALVSACKTHCDLHLGEVIGKKLIDMEPQDIGPYILLSNIYAAKGRWDDVEKVREMMKKKGLRKGTGISNLVGIDDHVVDHNISFGKKCGFLNVDDVPQLFIFLLDQRRWPQRSVPPPSSPSRYCASPSSLATPRCRSASTGKCNGTDVEATIKSIVAARFARDRSIVPALLRLQFHDCFVRGCDASILLDGSGTEKTAARPNLSVRGYDHIDQAKATLESECPGVVSCADIIVVATRMLSCWSMRCMHAWGLLTVCFVGRPSSAVLTGDRCFREGGTQYTYAVQTGKRDGNISLASDATRNLPGDSFLASQAIAAFRAKGLSASDMVLLLGGHTVGLTHCSFILNRLYNYNGSGKPDPAMDPAFVAMLKSRCPQTSTVDNTVLLDHGTPTTVDNSYYKQLLARRVVLKVDQNIPSDAATNAAVRALAGGSSSLPALFGGAW